MYGRKVFVKNACEQLQTFWCSIRILSFSVINEWSHTVLGYLVMTGKDYYMEQEELIWPKLLLKIDRNVPEYIELVPFNTPPPP